MTSRHCPLVFYEDFTKQRDIFTPNLRTGASGFVLTLGEPRHVDVTGESAYVVVPASMTFKEHGKQVTQASATLTMALRKLAGGWRIAAWAIAKGDRA